MEKAKQEAAFVQAQRSFLFVFFRTAFGSRGDYTTESGGWVLIFCDFVFCRAVPEISIYSREATSQVCMPATRS
jgi:hypothetical protein